MNTWLQAGSDGGNGGYLAGQWPSFWKYVHLILRFPVSFTDIGISGAITGWAGIIRVDGTSYTWMGIPGPSLVNQTAFEYTSTKSTFTMNVADLVTMEIAFISPVTPTNMLRLSLPFSYMDVSVQSLDGNAHDVQLYTDISAGELLKHGEIIRGLTYAEWVAGDRAATAQWDYGVTYGTGTSSRMMARDLDHDVELRQVTR